MPENIIEYWRKKSIENLFSLNSLENAWPTWKNVISNKLSPLNAHNLFNLGDSLREIFYSTNQGERGQSDVASGGTVWEALVCWYLNFCLIGRNTVVIKHNRNLIPQAVNDAIAVTYGNFVSNTEADLIAITFPENEFFTLDKDVLQLNSPNGRPIRLYNRNRYNLKAVIDSLADTFFDDIEIHVIQCKTNWNDNAQIPMLWDMIYSADRFRNNVSVGTNGRQINRDKFSYSFVTVPTVRIDRINSNSTCVRRVSNLSGGNYWGLETQAGVAKSIKEILNRNLSTGHNVSILNTLRTELTDYEEKYTYFNL